MRTLLKMLIPKILLWIAFFTGYLFLSTYLTVMLNFYFKNRRKPGKKSKKLVTVKNSKKLVTVKNDISDYQKIKTSEIILPVIKANVLKYAPGELGESFPEETNLYYSPEAISDKEFLESVIRSPYSVETHEKNTSEFNRSVDGWTRESWFDPNDKTVYAKGFLIGKDNVEYAKENLNTPTFGTSAFISFLKIDKENGKTPEGIEYNAIARKAICNHVAILPNIRDEQNKIVSINAKNAIVESTKTQERKNMALNMEDFKEAMQAYQAEQDSEKSMIEKITNAVLEKINSKNTEEKKETVNEDKPEEKKETVNEDKPEEKKEVEKEVTVNEDKKEEATNALPSESLVKTFADYYGVRFSKTPSFKQLAELAEIPYESFPKALNAIKKKAAEIQSETGALNSVNETETVKSINDIIKGF